MLVFIAFSLIVLLILLIKNKIRTSFLFFGLVLIYYFLDFISLEKMLSGFVNSSLITLILLLILSIVFEKTSYTTMISEIFFSKSYKKSLFKMSLSISFLSAFLNNTAVVASMISIVKHNRFHAPSKLLLPLSYAAIFGGTITLIGTSTNLLVNSFMIENNLEPFQLFDFMYVGIPIALAGALTLLFISKFLPTIENSKEIEAYFIEAKVEHSSNLIGKTVSQNKLRNLEYLFLSEILRDGKIISPVTPNEIIQENDRLLFSGDIQQINILKQFDKLKLENHKHNFKDELVEVIVSNESMLINKTIKEASFRSKFNASVVAIKRGNENISGKISEIPLQIGDNLVLSVGKDFHKRDNLKKNFYLMNSIGINDKLSHKESAFVVVGFISVLILSMIKMIPLVKGLFGLLAIFILMKFLKVEELKRRFPYELFLIIGSALGVASVMIESGLANELARIINTYLGSFGVYGAFVAVYLLTFLLTEIITNNAAAALSFPIAYSTALAFDSSILPFAMAVAYGASASFLMPFGYQTNLMVYSVGGYAIKTFLKSGIVVSIVYSILVITLVPLAFNF